MDLLCFDDMGTFADEIDDPHVELLQDLYHRLITPPGGNLDDPDAGLGIDTMLSGPEDPAWKSRIEREMIKDDRVAAAQAIVLKLDDGSFSIEIEIEADEVVLALKVSVAADGTVSRVP